MLAATYKIDIIYDRTPTKFLCVYNFWEISQLQRLSNISCAPILFNVLAGALCVNLTFLGNGMRIRIRPAVWEWGWGMGMGMFRSNTLRNDKRGLLLSKARIITI